MIMQVKAKIALRIFPIAIKGFSLQGMNSLNSNNIAFNILELSVIMHDVSSCVINGISLRNPHLIFVVTGLL